MLWYPQKMFFLACSFDDVSSQEKGLQLFGIHFALFGAYLHTLWKSMAMVPEVNGAFHGKSYYNPLNIIISAVNYNDLTVLPNPGILVFIEESSPNGRTIQVSELLFHLPRSYIIYKWSFFHGKNIL